MFALVENKDLDIKKDNSKEEIIVARNNEVYNSCSKYIGAEVAIGTLDDDFFASELESLALNEDLLWQRHPTGGVNADGSLDYVLSSKFLDNAFRQFNNLYHKEGLLFLEDIDYYEIDGRYGKDIDRYSESTDNWIFDQNHDYSSIKIPQKGNVILSIRMQDFHFKARGYFAKSLKKIPEENEFYNPEIEEYEEISNEKFILKPCIDNFVNCFQLGPSCSPLINRNKYHIPWKDNKSLVQPFSILYDVKLNDGEKDVTLEKERADEPLWYYSVHIVYNNGKIIGWLSTNNHPFNEDSSFPFYADVERQCHPDLLYCISPCPKENIKASSWENDDEYRKMQSFIFQDKINGDSRHYGIPANERKEEYVTTIKKLVSLLRA